MVDKFTKYPVIQPKNFNYRNDGTGRDIYVSQNNGGLLSQNMLKSLELKPKSIYQPLVIPTSTQYNPHRRSRNLPPETHNRITHYYGDGKGRDNHVTITDGGQCTPHNWRNSVEFFFKDQLRNYDQQWYSRPEVHKYLQNNQKLQKKLQLKSQIQKSLCRQLSMPKLHPPLPDQQETEYKSWQEPKYQSKSRNNLISIENL